MSSHSSSTTPRRVRCFPLLLLLLLLVLTTTLFTTADAVIASGTLRDSRIGTTYTYTMYNGTTVTGEGFVTGTTTYPYVFDSIMNRFVVHLLQQNLAFHNKSVSDVGGSLKTCMGNDGTDVTGKTCYKALLAANAPADCPAANVLCCPLFWRVGSQGIETTMAEMDVETIFWNGAYAINGYYANFSKSYLMENGNCSKPLFTDTTAITLAVDVTGEWRFVPLLSSYVLQETALNVDAAEAATYFDKSNPQDLINAAKKKQRPSYYIISSYYIPVIVCVLLLVLTGLFVVLTCCCGTRRTTARVHRAQLRLLELKSTPPPRGSIAILNDISPESSSRSSSEESRRSKRQAMSRRSSMHASAAAAAAESRSGNDSFSSGQESRDESDDDDEGDSNSREAASRRSSHKPKGSTKSLKSKGSSKSVKSKASAAASRKASAKKSKEAPFPPPPAALPGIRPRKSSAYPDDAPSRAASAHMAKRSSSTNTVVHKVNNPPPHPGSSQRGRF